MKCDSSIFKAYDIRGVVDEQLTEEFYYKLGKATVTHIGCKNLVVGHDMRSTSIPFKNAFVKGCTELGCNVTEIGLISTDMLFFAVGNYEFDAGVSITASHNPKQYNGAKFVKKGVVPISSETGLFDIRDLVISENFSTSDTKGSVITKEIYDDYRNHVLSFVDVTKIKPFKVVIEASNGIGGFVFNHLRDALPLDVIEMNFEPDGTFPVHESNPMIYENRKDAMARVVAEHADFGVLWDGDADRCFFIDEKGTFISGYYMTAILAESVLRKNPGAKIVCDCRVTWAVEDTVKEHGGTILINKPGHSFIKARMRDEDAVFGGENSAHYFFKDNFYADNGMIPLLLLLELLSVSGKSLHEILQPLREKFAYSEEINSTVDDADAVIERVRDHYSDAKQLSIDGLNVVYADWQFNLRKSNTEPLIRMNLEATSHSLMEEKRDEVLSLIRKV